MALDVGPLIEFYESLAPDSVGRIADLYAADAWFKDPFNEVRGSVAIERIFRHMFAQVREPRFAVWRQFVVGDEAMLLWEFGFRLRNWRPRTLQRVRGASHLRFDAAGRVTHHRDYWDSAEELYAKLPLLGCAARGLQRALRA